MTKFCISCNIEKDDDSFCKKRNQCKLCIKEKRKQYYKNNLDKFKSSNKQYYQNNIDKVKEWYKNNSNKIKEYQKNNSDKIKEYNKQYKKNNSDKIKEYNKDNLNKIKEYKKQYYKNNYDKLKESQKQYRQNNSDKKKKYDKLYYKNNVNKILKNKNKYDIQRKTKDPVYKLRKIISTAIRNALKRQLSYKNNQSSTKYLPYNIHQLKDYLEKLFEPWMNWENWGIYNPNKKTWQIDHIIPQSALPYISMEDSNFQKCWSLSNLRPLESLANIKKGNKIIDLT